MEKVASEKKRNHNEWTEKMLKIRKSFPPFSVGNSSSNLEVWEEAELVTLDPDIKFFSNSERFKLNGYP